MYTLESLGWSLAWAARFEPYARAGLVPGRISVEHRGLYHFLAECGEGVGQVSGRLRHEAAGRADFPAVGDWVALEQAAGANLAVIHAVLPRANKFSRKPPGRESDEQIVAANLDTLLLVTSLNRDLNRRRIERYLAAATAPRLETVLVLNKSDLCERSAEVAEEFHRFFGVPVHPVSAVTGDGLQALVPYLGPGRTAAMVGSSGVGKSTLLNRLLGATWQAVQEIRDDDRGRHTTTRREMIRLPQGGWLIDNPGMRELQLWDEGANLEASFTDVGEVAAACRYADCRHEDEPGCAVRQAIEEGRLDPERLESYRKLERELEYQQSRHDARIEQQRKEEVRRIHRIWNKLKRRRDRR
jgi:ribosome biogenesis GTPase